MTKHKLHKRKGEKVHLIYELHALLSSPTPALLLMKICHDLHACMCTAFNCIHVSCLENSNRRVSSGFAIKTNNLINSANHIL